MTGRGGGRAVAQGGIKAYLFNLGFRRKLHFMEQGHSQHTVRPRDLARPFQPVETPACFAPLAVPYHSSGQDTTGKPDRI